MAEPTWRATLRERWRVEFGGRFSAEELEGALDDVALFRRYGERLAHEPVELGEMPFPCLLPPLKTGGAS